MVYGPEVVCLLKTRTSKRWFAKPRIAGRKSCFFKKMVACIAVLAIGSFAFGDLVIPGGLPGWWPGGPGDPPDGLTRAQVHGFSADPNLNAPPDWTYDGFQPSVPDSWTMPGGLQYGVDASFWPVHYLGGGYLNDGSGIWLNDQTITKRMGNLRINEWIKEFYVLVIWHSPGGGMLGVDVDSELATDVVTQTMAQYDDGNWHATIVEGTIEPQPNWEDFTFTCIGATFIDTIMIGTHCPEPATLCLLVFGGMMVLKRRH